VLVSIFPGGYVLRVDRQVARVGEDSVDVAVGGYVLSLRARHHRPREPRGGRPLRRDRRSRARPNPARGLRARRRRGQVCFPEVLSALQGMLGQRVEVAIESPAGGMVGHLAGELAQGHDLSPRQDTLAAPVFFTFAEDALRVLPRPPYVRRRRVEHRRGCCASITAPGSTVARRAGGLSTAPLRRVAPRPRASSSASASFARLTAGARIRLRTWLALGAFPLAMGNTSAFARVSDAPALSDASTSRSTGRSVMSRRPASVLASPTLSRPAASRRRASGG
jgi:hypothetical protein